MDCCDTGRSNRRPGGLRMGCVFRHLDASSLPTGPLQQDLREPWLQCTAHTELRHYPVVPCQQHCVLSSSHTCCIWTGVRRMEAYALSWYHNVMPLMLSTETKVLAISHATPRNALSCTNRLSAVSMQSTI